MEEKTKRKKGCLRGRPDTRAVYQLARKRDNRRQTLLCCRRFRGNKVRTGQQKQRAAYSRDWSNRVQLAHTHHYL